MKYSLKYIYWIINGYLGRIISLDIPEEVTVLITYYNRSRMIHLEPMVRNICKCSFVNKVIISNHNPDVRIEEKIRFRDRRLIFINQSIKRGCGYRWLIANEFEPEYLIVIDDDVLFFSSQLAKLFKHLINEPLIPHGISGFIVMENDTFEFHEKENITVNFLCEAYAITRSHLKRYLELKQQFANNDTLINLIDSSMDFMIISQTGSDNPKIHHIGRIFRSPTFNQIGVAIHKADGFDIRILEASRVLINTTFQNF